MNIHHTLSESAFLVNESRARRVDISHDRYAQLWVSDATKNLWDDFSKQVYPYDDIELGLRNRFFLDCLNAFIASSIHPIFVNIGAGFTSYPFLVDHPCSCIEVDLGQVIDVKQKQIIEWVREGKLPDRQIDFFSADLTSASDVKLLKNFLWSSLRDRDSFILLEGITYYLDKVVLNTLFKLFSAIQGKDSLLAFDFWDPRVEKNPVYQKYIMYCADRFGHNKNCYTLFDSDFIRKIRGYELLELIDIQQLEKRYLPTDILREYDTILPENYVVLKRIKI